MWMITTTIIALMTIQVIASTTINSDNDVEPYLQSKYGQVCVTPGCVRASAIVFNNIDQSVNPCDDFYKFACGQFVKEAVISDDRSQASYVYMINDKIVEQLRVALEEPPMQNELKPLALLKKFYSLCMNTSAIEETGLQSIKAILQKMGGWPVLDGLNWKEDNFDWKRTMFYFRRTGFSIDGFIKMYVGQNVKNPSQRIINIDQATLGLKREYLVEGFDSKLVKVYFDYLVDIALIFGADKERALKEVKEAVEFEIELAQITLSKEERRNLTLLTNLMNVTELQSKYRSIPWLAYINYIAQVPGVTVNSSDTVDLGVPKFITKLETLLLRTPKRVQANYLMNQAVTDMVTFLTKELRNRALQYSEHFDGVTQQEPRWMECVKLTTTSLQIASGALYARNYLNPEAKKNAEELVSNLRITFLGMLKQVDWMDETTKAKAIEKAMAMYAHVAYPQELLDDQKLEEFYTNLNPTADSFLELYLNIKKFDKDVSFKSLPQPVNKTDWKEHSNIIAINAYYQPTENSLRLSAGILQGVFFDSERPHYMNYGSMGFVIGHEITHGFDDMGRQFDKDGELTEWWEEETKTTFLTKAQCIIDQYNNYTAPEVQLKLNGINTQGENIADNGGLKEAYLAYNAWVERNGEEPRLPGLKYTPKQMFWISAANFWCGKEREQFLRRTILIDPHSPSYFRVLGAFSNSEAFSQDFNCPIGSKMNPTHKCQVW